MYTKISSMKANTEVSELINKMDLFAKQWSWVMINYIDNQGSSKYQDIQILFESIKSLLNSFKEVNHYLDRMGTFERKEFYDKNTGSHKGTSAKTEAELFSWGYQGNTIYKERSYLQAKVKMYFFEDKNKIIDPLKKIISQINPDTITYPFFGNQDDAKNEIQKQQVDLLNYLAIIQKNI